MPKVLEPVFYPTIPFQQEIRGVFPGRLIYVYGKVPPNSPRFQIDLMYTDNYKRVVHFNPRFPQRVIVRNSALEKGWEEEEREGGFPMNAGDIFDIQILIKKRFFQFFVNGVHFANYTHRTDIKNIKDILITGDVELRRVQFEEKGRDWRPGAIIKNPVIDSHLEVPYANMIDHKMIVEGVSLGGRFSVNFFDKSNDTLFHFNPRQEDNLIVCNSKFGGKWQTEERHEVNIFGANMPFLIEFDVHLLVYKVKVNGFDTLEYKHRNQAGTADIREVAVLGSAKVNRVVFI